MPRTPRRADGTRTVRLLAVSHRLRVETDDEGRPLRIDDRPVAAIRDEWRVEEGWWTDAPVRRRYVEAVTDDGRLVVLYEDRRRPGTWFAHGRPPPHRG